MSSQVDAITIELPNDTTAPRVARRAVAEHLGDHPRQDDLLLCVSEVVTNAVLHARSAGVLRIRPQGGGVIIEVTDRDPNPPARRQHDLQAPTGRGLRLLDALTVAWGTSPAEGGKVVWFEFDLSGGRSMLATSTTTKHVRLVGVPLDVHRRASEHGETLRRELSLIRHTISADTVPARLAALGQDLAPHYQGLNSVTEEVLAEALASGDATVDLTYELPARAADDLVRIDELLDELDQFCRDRDLLTLVTPAESRAYRGWWLYELVDQVRDGRDPIPWTAPDLGAVEPPPTPGSGAPATIAVQGDLDLERAPSLRDEIVLLTEAGATSLVVDLSDCGFMDSTGISLLLTTQMRLDAEGGSLVLTNLSPQVASVLELSGLTELMT